MKTNRLLLFCALSVLLAGCNLMRPPSAKQTREQEAAARAAEATRAADARQKVIDDRAATQRERERR